MPTPIARKLVSNPAPRNGFSILAETKRTRLERSLNGEDKTGPFEVSISSIKVNGKNALIVRGNNLNELDIVPEIFEGYRIVTAIKGAPQYLRDFHTILPSQSVVCSVDPYFSECNSSPRLIEAAVA